MTDGEFLEHMQTCWKDPTAPWIKKPNWIANAAVVITLCGAAVAGVAGYWQQQGEQDSKVVYLETRMEYLEKTNEEIKTRLEKLKDVVTTQNEILQDTKEIRRALLHRSRNND